MNVQPDLIKATIEPTGDPLATDQVAGEIQESTGNELITHRLEEIEDRKDPERVRTNATNYTTYALRGFGPLNVTFGRGLYDLELHKPLRRQANTAKHKLRELKSRTPSNNRLIAGMALVSWGSEDGMVGERGKFY